MDLNEVNPKGLFLSVIEFGSLVLGFAGEADAQTAEAVLVGLGQDDSGMDLAASQFLKLSYRLLGVGVGHSTDGQGHQKFIDVEAAIDIIILT